MHKQFKVRGPYKRTVRPRPEQEGYKSVEEAAKEALAELKEKEELNVQET